MNMTGGVELHGHRLAGCLLPPEGERRSLPVRSRGLLAQTLSGCLLTITTQNKEKHTLPFFLLENTRLCCQVWLRGSLPGRRERNSAINLYYCLSTFKLRRAILLLTHNQMAACYSEGISHGVAEILTPSA